MRYCDNNCGLARQSRTAAGAAGKTHTGDVNTRHPAWPENGRVGFRERDVADLLARYGVTDAETRKGVLALVGPVGRNVTEGNQ
jgi:hypothetical protein